jgi:hypothetical protein
MREDSLMKRLYINNTKLIRRVLNESAGYV